MTVIISTTAKPKKPPRIPRPVKTPTVAKRIVTYAEAVTKWAANGRPVRDDQEVEVSSEMEQD